MQLVIMAFRKGLIAIAGLATSAHSLLNSIETRHPTISEDTISVFAGNSNRPLAMEISQHLGIPLGRLQLGRFADGEVSVKVLDHVRGKDVYIVQSTCPPVNEHLMELLFLISTMRRASAKRITAVIPYYGYGRQDRKMSSRVPISAADVARLLENMGVDRVIACDLHCGQIQGFFGPQVPVDNLECSIVSLDYFAQENLVNPVIVSPDAGGVYRAKKFQGFMTTETQNPMLAMIIKQRIEAGKIDRMDLVGSVQGSDCVIVDDIIDTAGTLCTAAEQLKIHGAKRVYAFATHGLFSKDALRRIENSPLHKVIVTNTIPLPGVDIQSTIAKLSPERVGETKKVHQVSVGALIGEAIRRLHSKESLSQLFYPKNFAEA
jgi:ribose-phosphate pyrophosphokinase